LQGFVAEEGAHGDGLDLFREILFEFAGRSAGLFGVEISVCLLLVADHVCIKHAILVRRLMLTRCLRTGDGVVRGLVGGISEGAKEGVGGWGERLGVEWLEWLEELGEDDGLRLCLWDECFFFFLSFLVFLAFFELSSLPFLVYFYYLVIIVTSSLSINK
jgi:hypothetical protein